MRTEFDAAIRMAIAALIGLAVGIEREWSGHSRGAQARFAGVRTFLLIGLIGGAGGVLLGQQRELAGSVLLLGGVAIAIVAYAMAVRRPLVEIDGTTEVAALVVVALGALAGVGYLGLAAAMGAIVVLALSEKERLHKAVEYVRQDELQAALRFAVLAFVVLPLLPSEFVLGPMQLEPRMLWIIVLIFSGLNFAAFVARRMVGRRHGYGIVGMLGGLISSTAVTFDFARASREDAAIGDSLAYGVIGACTVLIPRVLAVSAVLNTPVAIALLPLLFPAALIGAVLVARSWRARSADEPPDTPPGNPLRLAMAIRMALIFQVAILAITYFRSHFSATGLYGSAVALGLTDMDALTVGMSRPSAPLAPELAARAITAGMLANTVVKMGIAAVFGARGFRMRTVLGLAAIGIAIAAMLWLL